ncbi:MAG: efflux RND transporter periplasmic adaptor subunit [Ferrovum sp.]|nr:efflux RND transporter periplasmic adaptor subunit [Ferrovum sp.]NDU86798.1 efflux RND transporter periplasmic adaptor subunit [Ferrovum sp.]
MLMCSVAVYAEDQQSVLVKTEPITHKEALTFSISGYGTVYSNPVNTMNVNQPRSGQITRLNVTAGQIVKRGTTLFEFATDPNVTSGYTQADSALHMAQSQFDSVKRLNAQQLTTNAQLAVAEKALTDAKSALQAQKALGSEIALEYVKAPYDAIVSGIFASPGDRVQAEKTVLQIAMRDALLLRIGVQPEDVVRIRPGMKVLLSPVFDKSRKLHGEVCEVQGTIDSQTHLVDVIVTIDKATSYGLVPGMNLRGEIKISGGNGWVVPRSAVLTDEKGTYLFQDDRGRARRVTVNAIENGEMTVIQGQFDPHLPVVVLGNYELQDGMRLRESNR